MNTPSAPTVSREATLASSEPDGLSEVLEALELGRDYIACELAHRKDAYHGYPHKYAAEERDLAQVERIAAALRQRIGRE